MSASLDYALTEDIDFRDEWIESEHPRVPEGAPGGGQFTSGGAGGGVSGGGAPLLLPEPVGLHSDFAKKAYEMAVDGAHTHEIEAYAAQLIGGGEIGKYSKTAVYLENLVAAMAQQESGAPAPSATEIPHNAGMIAASSYAEIAYQMAMMPYNTSGEIQAYLELDIASGAVGKNSPAAQYIEEIIKAKKAQEAAHGTAAAEQVDIQAEPIKLTSFAPALTPKQQGEYAAGTATTELEQAAADPVKLAKFGEQSHMIGQSLNTPEALAGDAVQDAKQSIKTWTTPGPQGFHMITNHLMGKATSKEAAAHADAIQKAILSNSIPESVNAYRGVKGDMFQEIQTKQQGDSWTIKKFQATTIDPRKATYYAKGGKGGAMIHYVLPKGQKALYVSDPKLNSWEDEHELLLPAGSTIKLVGTSTVELPEYDYTGKQVGPGGPVKIYHVEMMQPGSPEFEAAHPRGEGGKFVAKPGSEALAEEEKFDGGAFDPADHPDAPPDPTPAPDPAKLPDLPSDAQFVAKIVWNGAKIGKTHAELSTFAEKQINNGKVTENGPQHEYIKQVLAAVKAQEGGAAPAPTASAPAAAPLPFPPKIPQEIKDGDSYQMSMAEAIEDWGYGTQVSAADIQGYLDKKIAAGKIQTGSPLHKYAQSVIAFKGGKAPAAAPTAGPAAYPAPFKPIEIPKPDLPNAPSAEHAYDQIVTEGYGIPWLKDYIAESLLNTNYEEGTEGVVVEGSDEHKYLQKLLRTLQQQKYAAQNAAQQPELFAEPKAAAPPPPPPKPKLGTGDPSDYGRGSSTPSKVKAVYETTNARRAAIGEKTRANAVRVSAASDPEAEEACPSLERSWWKQQDTDTTTSCREFLSGSKGINGALLGVYASGSAAQGLAHAENIDAAFEDDATVVQQDIRAFRGTKLDSDVVRQLKQALAEGKPALWERRGFTSLSLADSVYSTFEAEVYLNVTVRKGTRALGLFGMGRDAGYERENELLLRAGRPLEVYAIHEHEDGKHTIFAHTQN